jgi:hypothetical protein
MQVIDEFVLLPEAVPIELFEMDGADMEPLGVQLVPLKSSLIVAPKLFVMLAFAVIVCAATTLLPPSANSGTASTPSMIFAIFFMIVSSSFLQNRPMRAASFVSAFVRRID